jgi:hypothetical protein
MGRRLRLACGLAIAALLFLGALSTAAPPSADPGAEAVAPFADGREVTVTAHVVHDGILRENPRGARQSLDLESESLSFEGVSLRARRHRMTIPAPEYGDRRRTQSQPGRPHPPVSTASGCGCHHAPAPARNFGNPGALDSRSAGGKTSPPASARRPRGALSGTASNRCCGGQLAAARARLTTLGQEDGAAHCHAHQRAHLPRPPDAARLPATGAYPPGGFRDERRILAVVVFWVLQRLRVADSGR